MNRGAKFESNQPVGTSASLIAALTNPLCYPHPVDRVEILETHISWVLLTGRYAYKIKKPVNLGFLDFSTLEKRLACCNGELQLNRRLAPRLYLDVVGISGNPERPRVGPDGPAIEYAVKMVQFGQDQLASRLLKTGGLTPQHIERLAERIAGFHARAAISPSASQFGSPRVVLAAAMQNFDQIEKLPGAAEDDATLRGLRDWTRRELAERQSRLESRRSKGKVRECHGDLHLGNIALIDGDLVPFDCIEFSAELRWIDTASEVAFLVMDLIDRGRPDFAYRFLSSYLELAGDYDGVDLLRFYLVYRAMVRAKVHCLRAGQLPTGTAEYRRLLDAYRGYLVLAERFTHRALPALVILNGLSGSGKSTVAQMLLPALEAIRIRSDVERKRMHDLNVLERTAGGIDEGIYARDATRRVYQHLAQLARGIAVAGYRVIVDAAFLKRWQRDLLRDSAREIGVPFVVIALQCPEDVLRARIVQRQEENADASDADLAVLSHQIATRDPIAPEERDHVIALDSALPLESLRAAPACQTLIERLKLVVPRPAPELQ